MFRGETEYLRALMIYKFLTKGEQFKHKKDIGDVYELSSNGNDLRFFDMVKIRKTGKMFRGREILLLNVSPYAYVNLEGTCRFTAMRDLDSLFQEILYGFECQSMEVEENKYHNVLRRKTKHRRHYNQHDSEANYCESKEAWMKRKTEIYANSLEMSKGLLGQFEFFFVGDDYQMIKPLDFTGYLYGLARCLSDLDSKHWYTERAIHTHEVYFGTDRIDINERFHDYVEMANILGVNAKTDDIPCDFKSLEEIKKKVKSRIYIFLAVTKYFFKRGRMFSNADHKNINKMNYTFRSIYSALGGPCCIHKGEEDEMIAYFTAIRCSRDDLPLIINTNNKFAKNVMSKRFDLSI